MRRFQGGENVKNNKLSILVLGIVFGGAIFSGYYYYFYQDPFYLFKKEISVEKIIVNMDKDMDGVLDQEDMVLGARQEVKNKIKYKSNYYVGGYPPKSEGVCTDVVIRALMEAGYNLKTSMDYDISKDLKAYSKNIKKTDPNIDFRRVKNQVVFFRRHTKVLTLSVKPYNRNNLREWQGGDIVVLENGDHVGIISDKRRKDGVPYVIHNTYPCAKENNVLMRWYLEGRIVGHFRYILN